MSKLCSVTVTFDTVNSHPRRLKATSIINARKVIVEEFKLAAYKSESLNNAHILHVYIFFNGKRHLVEPLDKVTSKLKVIAGRPSEHGNLRLKRKKLEKQKHGRHGLRHLIQGQGKDETQAVMVA